LNKKEVFLLSLSKFDKLVSELMEKGYSRAAAEKIAAQVGRKKYGKKEFAAMAKKGKEKAARKKAVKKG
jgi:hypothetical protein